MIINALDILPLIVGLAVLFCTSYEFEFNLSEKIKANVLMEALYVSLSTIVLVMAASPKIASHLSNVRFDVMIVDFRDALRESTVNNKSAASRSKDM